MTKPNVFKYENRLAKTVGAKEGMTADQAVSAAQERIELVRAPTVAHIDKELATITRLRDAMKADPDAGGLPEMYQAANRILATAGLFDLEELGEAAYWLCELVSRFQSSGKFNLTLIDVHADGLRLLRDPASHSDEHRKAVLFGLSKVVESVA